MKFQHRHPRWFARCQPVRALALTWALALGGVGAAHALEDKGMGEDTPKRQPVASAGQPGAWQGRWAVTRNHPQIRTLGGALALSLDIQHKRNSPLVTVRWESDRAICPSPTDGPCEWIGAKGVAESARVVAGHLLVVLRMSADDSDPFVVWLEQPKDGISSRGTLISAHGELAYVLEARRP